jgi:hypothetical protein
MGIKTERADKITKWPVDDKGQSHRQDEWKKMNDIVDKRVLDPEFQSMKGIDVIIKGNGYDPTLLSHMQKGGPAKKDEQYEQSYPDSLSDGEIVFDAFDLEFVCQHSDELLDSSNGADPSAIEFWSDEGQERDNDQGYDHRDAESVQDGFGGSANRGRMHRKGGEKADFQVASHTEQKSREKEKRDLDAFPH